MANSSSTFSVQIEATPNPNSMTFRFSQNVTESSFDFPNLIAAEKSPLAHKLFGFPWTSSVFLGPNYLTVTKQDWVEWSVLAEPLAGLIKEHLDSGEPVILDTEGEENLSDISEDDSDLVKQIKLTLNREIRPVVAMDGGDIQFAKIEENKLFTHMRGACSGCPSSQATLKDGIEVRIRELFPSIQEVVAL